MNTSQSTQQKENIISIKIIALSFTIIILSSIMIIKFLLPMYEQSLFSSQKEIVHQQAEQIWNIFDRLNQEVITGTFSEKVARDNAIHMLKTIRFGTPKNKYFNIIDLNNNIIIDASAKKNQPIKKHNPDNIKKYSRLIDMVQQKGYGFSDEPVLSPHTQIYVRYFMPWKWVLMCQIDTKDVLNQVLKIKKIVFFVYALFLLFGIMVSFFLARNISNTLFATYQLKMVKYQFRLQTFVLLIIIPTLIVITTLWGLVFYYDTYDIILSGFDNKLSSICTLTGCFIDGEENINLVKKRDIRGMDFNVETGELIGIDRDTTEFILIETDTGYGIAREKTGIHACSDIAFDSETRQFYIVKQSDGSLVSISADGKKMKPVADLNFHIKGMTFDPQNRKIIVNTLSEIFEINPDSGEILSLMKIKLDISGLAFDTANNRLYAIDEFFGNIYYAEMEAKQATLSSANIKFEVEGEDIVFMGLAYDPKLARFYTNANGLKSFDLKESKDPAPYYIDNFHNEKSEIYLKYTAPMKKIATRLNLTYLYSQIIAEQPYCVYIIDATIGNNEHTPIGYKDVLPIQDYNGGKKVMQYGVVHIGEVQRTQSWGLLKVSYAPILNDDGTISAMSGADIDVTPILIKQRKAMYAVFLMAIASMLIAGLFSFLFSQQLTRSIDNLKNGTLKVASGQYDYTIAANGPLEIKQLGNFSNQIGNELKKQLDYIEKTNTEMENSKCMKDLLIDLDSFEEKDMNRYQKKLFYTYFNNIEQLRSSSGWFCTQVNTVAWVSESFDSALDNLRFRNDIRRLIERLITQESVTSEWIQKTIYSLLIQQIRGFFFYNERQNEIFWIANQPINIMLIDNQKTVSYVTLENGHRIDMDTVHLIVFTDLDQQYVASFIEHLKNTTNLDQLHKIEGQCLIDFSKNNHIDKQIMMGMVYGKKIC
ncbi:MAG: cache domain-containing protein [Candidatus Magnetomorum sp.]|nr:cache domain-containing protein [Candidatus Magnetomorum sp.]